MRITDIVDSGLDTLEKYIDRIEETPLMSEERVANRNKIRAATVVIAGAVSVSAAMTGHKKLAAWSAIYAGAQTLTGVMEHAEARQASNPVDNLINHLDEFNRRVLSL